MGGGASDVGQVFQIVSPFEFPGAAYYGNVAPSSTQGLPPALLAELLLLPLVLVATTCFHDRNAKPVGREFRPWLDEPWHRIGL